MFHILYYDGNTGATSFVVGYFRTFALARIELDRLVSEYVKYPDVHSDYELLIVENKQTFSRRKVG